jgi:hypothetical protein
MRRFKLIAPFLSEGLVPKRLPTSTLQRLKTWCEQINIDVDDLEYGLDYLWMYSLHPRKGRLELHRVCRSRIRRIWRLRSENDPFGLGR